MFTPSILTILGVVMYLRFGWVVGNAGLAGSDEAETSDRRSQPPVHSEGKATN